MQRNQKTALELDIEVGDIVNVGRFKNKPIKVETLGTDELGQPTVNGRKLLSLRINKLLPKDKQSKLTQEKTAVNAKAFLAGYQYKEAGEIVGITRVPTGFRFHLPRKVTSLSAKQAEKEPIRHVLVAGSPGSGKTTLSGKLESERKLPVIHGDELSPGKHKYPGTHELRKALQGLKEPHIVEGAQVLGLGSDELSQHEVILLEPSNKELIRRLIARGWDDSSGQFQSGPNEKAEAEKVVKNFNEIITKFKSRLNMQKVPAEAYLDGYKEAQGPAVDPDKKLAAQFYKLLVQRPELEGFRDRVYPDVSGKRLPTIGYGINLQDSGNKTLLQKLFGNQSVEGWQTGQPMSQAQAGRFVQQRAVQQDIPELGRLIPSYPQLPDSARLALLSMYWNSPKLVGPKLRQFIQKEDWPAATGEIAYGHSGTLPGLIKRRIFEALEFGKGFNLTPKFEETPIDKRKAVYDSYMQSLQKGSMK